MLEVYNFIASNDSETNAFKLVSDLEKTFWKLSELAGRGHIPPELERIGIYDFSEILSVFAS